MGIRQLIKNLKCLKKIDLKEKIDEVRIAGLIDSMKYELIDDLREIVPPVIKTVDDTIEEIIKTGSSICRFGDGELSLMSGTSIPFQVASPELSGRLIEVLSSSYDKAFLAIPRLCYYSKKNITDINKKFWRSYESEFRDKLEKVIDFSKIYYSAEMSLAYSTYKEYNHSAYFENISKIWDEKNITIICGSTIFNTITHNIFDNAESISYQFAPSRNAFESYNEILDAAKKVDISHVLIIILGPTATVLAYDLCLLGYQALDLGHIAKSYDWYCKEKEIKNLSDAFNFFDPD